MKKIGILTFHRATNYGAVLQSYGLITYLKKHMCDADFEIIDYSTRAAAISHIRTVMSCLKALNFKAAIGEYKKNRMFKRFSDRLPISVEHIVSDEIVAFNEMVNSKYDVVITGSDAIFSWNGKQFPTAYFLHDIKCPKLSYAASAHRLMYKEEPEERLAYSKESFESLHYVGIRDEETENFVKYTGAQVIINHNCDPTFLLDISDIHKKADFEAIKKKCGITNNLPIIVIMTPDRKIAEIVKSEFGEKYKIISVFIDNKVVEPTIYDLTPFEWASLFSMASLTITEYFHATILSLLNSTPTLAIDKLNSQFGYEGKIKDLLYKRLNMPELYLNIAELNNDYSKIIELSNQQLLNFNRQKLRSCIDLEKKNVDSFIATLNSLV